MARALEQEVKVYWRGATIDRLTIDDGESEITIPLVLSAERVVRPGEIPSVTLTVFGRLVEHYEEPERT